MGLAVSLDDGLIVPVIRDAAQKSSARYRRPQQGIGRESARRKTQTRGHQWRHLHYHQSGNLWHRRIHSDPESGRDRNPGWGRIVEKPAIYRGEMARRSMMTLSLTFDHRVIDGAPAASFLQTVIDSFQLRRSMTTASTSPARSRSASQYSRSFSFWAPHFVRARRRAKLRRSPKRPPAKPIDWDKLTQEATDFLSKYIKINTTNPPGNEFEAAKFLKDKFLSEGIPADTWEPEPGRGIVAARLRGIGKTTRR